jgi:hypothetical protein
MSKEYYNTLRNLIKSNNLKELINLYENETLTRNAIEHNNFYLFRYACFKGKLEICQWLYETFLITKKEALIYGNSAFRLACDNGHLEVCRWLYETFQIKRKKVILYNNWAFRGACRHDHYEIISFLCNTFGIMEKDVKNIIEEYSKEKQEKILDCFIPFGSFTKPVKK